MDGWITDNEPSERYPIYTRANAEAGAMDEPGDVLVAPVTDPSR